MTADEEISQKAVNRYRSASLFIHIQEKNEMKLQNKIAIITGAAMGIGQGIAFVFGREGARMVIADVNVAEGQKTTRELQERGYEALFVECDVSKEDQVKAMMEAAVERYGTIHILVNNAAIGMYKTVLETTSEEWDLCLGINLKGAFLCSKYAIPHIRLAGGGSIINIASVHSHQNSSGSAPYAASKGGLLALTRQMSIDFGKDKIRVNAVCPGWTYTPNVQRIFDRYPDPAKFRQEVEQRQILGRLGTIEDIGEATAFLASDAASYITGSSLMVDNGMTAQLEVW
jgi:NAD(P)-dependent dehydrogenase (short-subunit alcohol dehydrogenase family)